MDSQKIAQKIEGTAAHFSAEVLERVRKKTWVALERISHAIKPGLLETEAHEIAKKILQEMGATQNWHRPLVRFGSNTLLTFSEPSREGVKLGENDIYFLDIGPVWEGHEGDVGDTFCVGNDPEMKKCAEDVKKIFDTVHKKWRSDRLTGPDLYQFAVDEAHKMGWVLNLKTDGHRLSEFPHQVHFRAGLTEIDFVPQEGIWVLEIQIRHPQKDFGAFYEDLLIT